MTGASAHDAHCHVVEGMTRQMYGSMLAGSESGFGQQPGMQSGGIGRDDTRASGADGRAQPRPLTGRRGVV
jgi:hypothetical protein